MGQVAFRKPALFFIVAFPAFALDNGVRLSNNTTGTLTNQFVSFGRYFAEGEIPNHPRPFARPSDTGIRSAVTTWQTDVKTRWRNASAVRTLMNVLSVQPQWVNGVSGVGFQINGNVGTLNTTTGIPHGLSYGDAIIITGTTTDADMRNGDPWVVYEVVDQDTVRVLHRGGISSTAGAWTARWVIDPNNKDGMRLTAPNHDFRVGETVTCSGVNGIAAANGTFIVTGVSRDHFVVNVSGVGNWSGGGTCTGPAPGSAKHVLISFFADIPNGGSTYVDFVNDGNPCSSGNQAACNAAGLDKTEMTAASWDFAVDFTADVLSGATATFTRNARTILADWNEVQKPCGPRYWARGPVLTWLILENNCLNTDTAAITVSGTSASMPYDFGWRMAGTGSASQTLTTAIGNSSIEVGISTLGELADGSKLWINNTASSTSATGAEILTVNGTPNIETTTCDGQTITLGTPCVPVTRQAEFNSLRCGAGGMTCPVGRIVAQWQWTDAAAGTAPTTSPHYSLRPSMQLRFVNGVSGVGARMEVSNNQWSKHQNQWYAVDIRTGNGLPIRKSIGTFKHTMRTSWMFNTWDGADPEFFCKDQGSDPENCSSVILTQGVNLTNIVVDGNGVTGTATVNCSTACGVSVGQYIWLAGVTTAFAGVSGNRMDGGHEVLTAGANSFTFRARRTPAGTYADSTITISRGTRQRKVIIDHNTPYAIYSKLLPQWRLYNTGQDRTTLYRDGHWLLDGGAVGVKRTARYIGAEQPRTRTFPGLYMGWSTWGNDQLPNSEYEAAAPGTPHGVAPMTDYANDTQEQWLIQNNHVAWIQNWKSGGYDFTFGDSTPGGGGNVAGQQHNPLQATEDGISLATGTGIGTNGFVNRPYMMGFSEYSFGRPLTNLSRLVYFDSGAYAGGTQNLDRPLGPCATTTALVTLVNPAYNTQWPCSAHSGFFIGNDGWGLEPAHHNDEVWLPYVNTADYSLLRTMERQAFWLCNNVGTAGPAGNLFRKPWCFVDSGGTGQIRIETSPMRQMIQLAAFYPNVPQWGQATVPVESYFYDWELWDIAKAEEGGAQITDGWTNAFYGFQPSFTMDCVGYDATDRGNSQWHFNRCGTARYNDRANALHWPDRVGNVAACGGPPTCSPAACTIVFCNSGTYAAGNQWMTTYSSLYHAHSENVGLKQFNHTLRKTLAIQVNTLGNQLINKYLSTLYVTAAPIRTDGTMYQNFEEWRDGWNATWPFNLTNGTGATMERDNLVSCDLSSNNTSANCSGPIGYPLRSRVGAALATAFDGVQANIHTGCTPGDVPPNGCTGQTAYDRIDYITADPTQNPKYSIVPRDRITNLVATPGGGSVTINYNVTSTDNCTYRLATVVPDSTLDNNDTADGQTVVGARQLNIGGLSNGTYHFRLTCGQRLDANAISPGAFGTTRTSTQFQIGAVAPPTNLRNMQLRNVRIQ